MNKNFIHLRTHSSYSLAEGAIKISDLVGSAVKNQMPAIALTDSGNLFASLEFSMEAVKKGVQPIIGCLLKVKITEEQQHYYDQILLLAKDNCGYENLLWLVSNSFLSNSGETLPHIELSWLLEKNEGLIALTGGVQGTVGRYILAEQPLKAENFLLLLKKHFDDRLYIELMRHSLDAEIKTEPVFLELAFKHNIPLVATNDAFFVSPDMHEAHEILLCIADGEYIVSDTRRKSTKQHYFKSSAEMSTLFADIPEAIENTMVIAKRCYVKANESPIMFPRYEVVLGKDEEEEIRILAKQGLDKRIADLDYEIDLQEYYNRLEFELDVIIRMRFPGYFLIVSDFIKWSKRNDIPVGPGRGSGAGSIVAWSLEITDLDPLRFGLLFERFLNPERVSMPDFDIDFCQDRREEVIQYVRQKYGHNRVANIITFGKLQARAVIRDVGRVLQMPYSQVDRISKLVPFNPVSPVTLSAAIEMEPQLKQAKDSDEEISHLLDIALKLEGLNRHASTHAAGIVIGNQDLIKNIPLYKDPKSGGLVVQYSMKYAEAAGLIKFDFLGLKTLTVIANCSKYIREFAPDFNINKIALDDPETYRMLSRGESVGVFQFESAGMRDALRKLRPDEFEDLIALGALYRPGPMDNIPTYIACKHGLLEPDYLHPSLEPTLKKTFGVIIYQEQVMEIAQVLAGYSLGAADLLRRAMGKKIVEEMDAQRNLFVSGAIAKGIDGHRASTIFDLVAKFAGYGFNKSHAVAYALISYQTAYLKANYPVEMLVALINSEIDDTDKISHFIQEAKKLDIPILAPDINQSLAYFSIARDKNNCKAIRYGLAGLKNVGLQAMELVCQEREKNGRYNDVFNFAARCDQKVLNKRQLENLIKAGAFDQLNNNRKQLFDSLEIICKHGIKSNKTQDSQQLSLFDIMDLEVESVHHQLVDTVNWNNDELLENESNALGFYLSAHPLDLYTRVFSKYNILSITHVLNELPEGIAKIKMAAIPISVRTRVSPKGRYVSVLMSDATGNFEISIFDDDLIERNRDYLYSKTPLIFNVDVRKDAGGARLLANQITKLENFMAMQRLRWIIEIDQPKSVEYVKRWLNKEARALGKIEVILRVHVGEDVVDIELPDDYQPNLTRYNEKNLPEGVISITQIV